MGVKKMEMCVGGSIGHLYANELIVEMAGLGLARGVRSK